MASEPVKQQHLGTVLLRFVKVDTCVKVFFCYILSKTVILVQILNCSQLKERVVMYNACTEQSLRTGLKNILCAAKSCFAQRQRVSWNKQQKNFIQKHTILFVFSNRHLNFNRGHRGQKLYFAQKSFSIENFKLGMSFITGSAKFIFKIVILFSLKKF